MKENPMKKFFASVIMLMSLLFVSNSYAADIKSEKLKNGITIITLIGDIEHGDGDKFRKIVLKINEGQVVVMLGSNGGTVVDALEIGKTIRFMEYATYVPKDVPCNSSCALIWVAGSRRMLDQESRIGFHAIYVNNNGVKQESGAGNAVVGNYLASFNLSENAIIYMTSASPTELNWITADNAAVYGIDVTVISNTGTTPSTAAAPAVPVIETVDGWKISIDQTVRNGCFAIGYYPEFAFRIGYDENRRVYVIMAGKGWTVKEGQHYKIYITLDKHRPWTGDFVAVRLGSITVLKGLSKPEFLSEFASAKRMIVSYNGKPISMVNLPSADKMVYHLAKCQADQDKNPFH